MHVMGKIFSKGTFKSAASPHEIRLRLEPALDEVPFKLMLKELFAEGKLMKTDSGYRIPSKVAEPSLEREKLLQRLSEFIRRQGLATFSTGTFWELHGDGASYGAVKKLLDQLHADGTLVLLNDGRYMATEAMHEIRQRVKDLILRKGSLSVGDSREILGYGRTRAAPVLDYLDTIGFTMRIGDGRVLKGEAGLVRHGRT
jgi:selenocysteine-specific elongation factor